MQDKDAPRLSPAEIERYKRHLVLKEVGGQGQQRLKAARVLVVGAGGLGPPLVLYLAAAGVGTIGIVDDDRVSLDNLQRQIAHDTDHVGEAKVLSAGSMARRLNPHINIEPIETRLDAGNAAAIIGRHDIVADGSDNAETRYLVSDACYFAKRRRRGRSPIAPRSACWAPSSASSARCRQPRFSKRFWASARASPGA